MGKKVYIRKYKEVWLPENGISRHIAAFETLDRPPCKPSNNDVISMTQRRRQDEDSLIDRLTLSPRRMQRLRTTAPGATQQQQYYSGSKRLPCPSRRSQIRRSTSNLSDRSHAAGKWVRTPLLNGCFQDPLENSPVYLGSPSPGTTSRSSLRCSSSREYPSRIGDRRMIAESGVPLDDDSDTSYYFNKVYSANPNRVLKMRHYFGEMENNRNARPVVDSDMTVRPCQEYRKVHNPDRELKRRATSVKKLTEYYEDKQGNVSKVSEVTQIRPLYVQMGCDMLPSDIQYRRSSAHLNGDVGSYTTEDTNSIYSVKQKSASSVPYRSQSLGISQVPFVNNEHDTGSNQLNNDLRLSPVSSGLLKPHDYTYNEASLKHHTRQLYRHELVRSKSNPDLASATKNIQMSRFYWNTEHETEDNPPYRSQQLSRYSSNGNVSDRDTERQFSTRQEFSSAEDFEEITPSSRHHYKEKSPRQTKRCYFESIPKRLESSSSTPVCERYEEIIHPVLSEVHFVPPPVSQDQHRDYPYGFTSIDAEKHVQKLKAAHKSSMRRTTNPDNHQPEFVERARSLERRREQAEYERLREFQLYLGRPSLDRTTTTTSTTSKHKVTVNNDDTFRDEYTQQLQTEHSDGSTNHRTQHRYYEKLGLRETSPVRCHQVTENRSIRRTHDGLRVDYDERVTQSVGKGASDALASATELNSANDAFGAISDPHSLSEITERNKKMSHKLARDYEKKYSGKSTESNSNIVYTLNGNSNLTENRSNEARNPRGSSPGQMDLGKNHCDLNRRETEALQTVNHQQKQNDLGHHPSSPEMEYVWDQESQSWRPLRYGTQIGPGCRMEWSCVMDQCVESDLPERSYPLSTGMSRNFHTDL